MALVATLQEKCVHNTRLAQFSLDTRLAQFYLDTRLAQFYLDTRLAQFFLEWLAVLCVVMLLLGGGGSIYGWKGGYTLPTHTLDPPLRCLKSPPPLPSSHLGKRRPALTCLLAIHRVNKRSFLDTGSSTFFSAVPASLTNNKKEEIDDSLTADN